MGYRDDGAAAFLGRDTHDAASHDTLVEDFGSGKEQEDASLLDTTYQPKSISQWQRLHASPRWKRSTVVLGGFLLSILLLLSMALHNPLARTLTGRHSSDSRSRQAVAVLLTDYHWIPQLSALAYSLDVHSPGRDRIVIIPDTFNDEEHFPNSTQTVITEKLGWKLRIVPFLDVPKSGNVAHTRYQNVMNKLWIWNMTEYDGIGFLDLDGLVVGNLDRAFDILQVSDVSLASVPDEGPGYDQARASPQAGSMWAKPNVTVFQEMLVYKNDSSKYDTRWPEQLMLNRFFWGRWVSMPARYGLQVYFANRDDWPRLREEAAFLHFTRQTKPWEDKWTGPHSNKEKMLWRENLVNATREYRLSLEELTSGGRDLGWPVAKLAGLA